MAYKKSFNSSRSNRGGGFGKRNSGGKDGGRPSKGKKELFAARCGDCGKDCEVPFRPTGKFPVFCSTCFGHQPESGKNYTQKTNRDSLKKSFEKPIHVSPISGEGITTAQFQALEKKVDAILALLQLQTTISEASKKVSKKGNINVDLEIGEVVAKPANRAAKKALAKKTPAKKKAAVKKSVAKKKTVAKKNNI